MQHLFYCIIFLPVLLASVQSIIIQTSIIDVDTYRKNMTDTITMLKTLTQLSTNNQMMKGQGTIQKAKIEINVLESLFTTARTMTEAIPITARFR